jgi:hypothetical protein
VCVMCRNRKRFKLESGGCMSVDTGSGCAARGEEKPGSVC